MDLNITIKGNRIYSQTEEIASGTENSVNVCFTFDPAWHGYARTAVMFRSFGKQYSLPLDNDSCPVPSALLEGSGRLYVGVFGSSGDKIITTGFTSVNIFAGAADNGIPEPPEAYVYTRILDMVTRAVDNGELLHTEVNARLDEHEKHCAERAKTFEEAESVRRNAEQERLENEAARIERAATLTALENDVAAAEVLRREAELERCESEEKRAELSSALSELERKASAAEEQRCLAEAERIANETAREGKYVLRRIAQNAVYARENGEETDLPFSDAAEAGSLVRRTATGGMRVADPVYETDAVNKRYADKHGGMVNAINKRVKNLELAITPSPFIADDTVAYSKSVPENALPYAEISRIGGMTRACTNLIPASAVAKTVDGITYTLNEDGSIWVKGTATANHYYTVGRVDIAPGTYTLSGCPEGGSSNTYVLYLQGLGVVNGGDTGSGKTVVISERLSCDVLFLIRPGAALDTVLKPMLNEGGAALPYEPYFEGLRSAFVTAVESVGDEVQSALLIPETVRALEGYGEGLNESCFNYVNCESGEYVRCVGKVDMGTLSWIKSNGYAYSKGIAGKADGCCLAKMPSAVSKYYLNDAGNIMLLFPNDAYADGEAVRSAISGITLYYELAVPERSDVSTLMPSDCFVEVEAGGTVTMVNEHGSAVPSTVIYQIKEAEV